MGRHKEVESACKPGSVRLATRQSFLSARRRRLAPATYPGTTRAALSFPYLVLLRVGFTVPRDVSPACGALLPHPFTLTTHIRRCRSAVCSLLHWPSAHAAQELPGTLPYGARTFLDALACDATARPTPPPSLVGAHSVRDVFRGVVLGGPVLSGSSSTEGSRAPPLPTSPASRGRSKAGRPSPTVAGDPLPPAPARAPSVRSLPACRGGSGWGALRAREYP
jgi:hypothetical protein